MVHAVLQGILTASSATMALNCNECAIYHISFILNFNRTSYWSCNFQLNWPRFGTDIAALLKHQNTERGMGHVCAKIACYHKIFYEHRIEEDYTDPTDHRLFYTTQF